MRCNQPRTIERAHPREYEDFLTGLIVDNGDVWGRPVGTTELEDGSLLLGDDGGNIIYRIWYEPPGASADPKASGQ